MTLKNNNKTSIAVVGIGCMFPKAENLNKYWENIKNKVDAITEIPPTHWQPADYFDNDPKRPDFTYSSRGGFLDSINFNPMEFGITPNAMEATDTSQLLSLVVAQKALDDAGYGINRSFNRDKVSVILGVTGTQELVIPLGARLGHPLWRKAMKEYGVSDQDSKNIIKKISDSYVDWQENSFPGLLGNVVAGRIANRMDFGGTNCVVDAACASSFSALHLALMELASGKSDMVVTGGIDTFNNIFMYMCFSKTTVLSASGDAKPFDCQSDGTVLGEGLGMLVIKRLEDAERDNDKIYAVIRGVGTSSDGKGNAIYVPSSSGQTKAIKDAYSQAGISPDTIELVEAHGTGTKVGDATEIKALTGVYASDENKEKWCAIGSVKSQIGHTKAAAGIAGLIKNIMALHHKVLPPTIKVERPVDELLSEKTPFYVNIEKRPWISKDAHPRRAAVSAFGFGGSNFHCLLEEYKKDKTKTDWNPDIEILSFSANTFKGIKSVLEPLSVPLLWNDIAAIAVKSRREFVPDASYRLIFVVQKNGVNIASIADKSKNMLTTYPEKEFWTLPEGAYFASREYSGKLGIIFPGQGSQYPGMLRDMACIFPEFQKILGTADSVFQEHREAVENFSLSDCIYPFSTFDKNTDAASEKRLQSTEIAQPAIGAVSLGAFSVLNSFGLQPDAVAGHSYGELTALSVSGRINQKNLHNISNIRGRLMGQQSIGIKSAMLAVRASLHEIQDCIKKAGLDLVIANKNAPNQAVLSGAELEVEKAVELFTMMKVSNKILPVSAAFHSQFVSSVSEPFYKALKTISFIASDIPVFANSTAKEYPVDIAKTRTILSEQLTKPVEFVQQIENMYKSGVTTFCEVGPGRRLSGLVESILGDRRHNVIALDASSGKKDGSYDLAAFLAQCAVLGHKVNLAKWNEGIYCETNKKEEKKPGMSVSICGANYTKPKKKSKTTQTTDFKQNVVIQTPEKEVRGNPVNTRPKSYSEPNNLPMDTTLQTIQQNMAALLKMQEQTANIHQQFLEGQEAAQQNLMALISQQQQIFQNTGEPVPVFKTPKVSQPSVFVSPEPELKQEIIKEEPPVSEHVENEIEHIKETLLNIVSEKTGYPLEVLDMDMGLDADLGIDSIKQVEILSAVQEKLPEAPEVKPEHMGTLQTLKQLVDFLNNGKKVVVETTVPQTTELSNSIEDRMQESSGVETALLEIVSEKTGYPVEVLDIDMKLDSDLGIDSIKQVEILSALQERLPNAPEVKPEHMGQLQTLRQLIVFLSSSEDKKVEIKSTVAAKPVEKESEETVKRATIMRSVLAKHELNGNFERKLVHINKGAEIWITGDESSLAKAIEKRLKKLKYKPTLISISEFKNRTQPKELGGLLILTPAKTSIDNSFLKDVFKAVQFSSPGLKKAATNGGAIFATLSRLDGAFGLGTMKSDQNPLSGGLAGFTKTAQHEWPDVRCKALDISSDFSDTEEAASRIVDELFTKGQIEVGISQKGNCTVTLNPSSISSGSNDSLKENDLIVITGGARGVTADVSFAIGKAFKPVMLLLGRSELPSPEPEWVQSLIEESQIKKAILVNANGDRHTLTPKNIEERFRKIMTNREIRKNIKRIESTGAKVIYRSVDVRDAKALDSIIDEAQNKYGSVKGLIHGAGVLADRMIEDKTEEQFEMVYSTKVNGLQTLLKLLSKNELKIMVMFSSFTGRYGRAGQVDYAVANEVLNKIAQQQSRLRSDCRVVSVNWGPWDGGMVTPNLRKIFENEGIGLINPSAGAEYLVQEINNTSENSIEVVIMGEGKNFNNQGTTNKADRKSMSTAFDLNVNTTNYPFLMSHVINRRAVVPMAVIVEWMAHAAMHLNPGLKFHGFNDLRILKGVIIDPEKSVSIRFLAGKCVQSENIFSIPVEMQSPGSNGHPTVHATAQLLLTTKLPTPTQSKSEKFDTVESGIFDDIYENILFHGSDLQGIKEIESCSSSGIAAKVKTSPTPSKWFKKPLRNNWSADPLALDSSFQMMILWSFDQYESGSLPCFAGNYRQYKTSFPNDGVRVVIRVTDSSQKRATADIDFQDPQGNLIARMEGYECVIDQSLNRTFRDNQLVKAEG